MSLDRRALLGAAGAAIAAPAFTQAAFAQTPAAPPLPPLTERITNAARQNSLTLNFADGRFSGPAYEKILAEGRAAHFFMLGEEHGVSENAQLAGQLFEDLAPSGYAKACIEVSPPMASEMDRALRGGVDGFRAFFADPGSQVAFFGMREEAEWLARARAAAPSGPFLWGLDYEVGADRRLVALLKAKRKPAAAETALAALEQAQTQSWARYYETRDPQHIYSFAGDPDLVRAIRQAWPRADQDAVWILDTLEETFAINRHWQNGQGYLSNERRARFMRANLLRYLARERETPRIMFKFGANHVSRGLTSTYVHDVGTLAAEFAEAEGRASYRLLVLAGPGGQIAAMDPAQWRYNPQQADISEYGIDPLFAAAPTEGFTLIDLRALRELASGRRANALSQDMVRTIHGYDALLVLANATASENL